MHRPLRADRAHIALLALAAAGAEPAARRFAAVGLVNLSAHPANHADLIAEGAVRTLVMLCGGAAAARAAAALGPRPPPGYDEGCAKFAALALGNLAADPDNHDAVLAGGALPALVAVLADAVAVERRVVGEEELERAQVRAVGGRVGLGLGVGLGEGEWWARRSWSERR
jgi:hypothetical protein